MKRVRTNSDHGGDARITGLPAPGAANDAARLADLQAVQAGLVWKPPVRSAADDAVNLAAPGAAIGGAAAFQAGQRFLAMNQADHGDDGVYVWNGAAVPATRAPDFDEGSEIVPGTVVPILEGEYAEKHAILTNDAAIVVGVTDQIWVIQSGGISAGDGLELLGNVLALLTPVTVARGGTGANTAAGARAALGATTKYTQTIAGDGALTSFDIDHNLGTTDILEPSVRQIADDEFVDVEKDIISANRVQIRFNVAPINGEQFRVVVVG